MSDASPELFQAVIDDHRRRPRNRGPLPSAHRVVKRDNPSCGDVCTIQLQLDPAPPAASPAAALPCGTRIVAAAFTGAGCALSQAAASLATVALTGRTVDEAIALAAAVEQLVRTGSAPSAPSSPPPPPRHPLEGDLAALAAVRAFPARHACALLAWRAAVDALRP